MGNKAHTIQEQLDKLSERGLILDNYDQHKLEEIFLDIGYYRLGFYWHYFQDKKNHKFEKGISLEDIIKLYYFDFDLKMLILRYIYRIEVHFRTQLIYYVSNYYKDNNTWYTDSKILNSNILKDFNNIYFNLKTKNKTIRRHHKKYKCQYAPAWKVFEFLTFGQIFKIYSNLKNTKLKQDITKVYGINDIEILDNFFLSLINIRNICSHNGVLYDFNQPKGIRKIPDERFTIKSQNQTNLNASLKLLLFVLSKVSENRSSELETEFIKIFNEGKKNIVIKRMIDEKIKFEY